MAVTGRQTPPKRGVFAEVVVSRKKRRFPEEKRWTQEMIAGPRRETIKKRRKLRNIWSSLASNLSISTARCIKIRDQTLFFWLLGWSPKTTNFHWSWSRRFHAWISVRRICQVKTDSARVRFMPIKLHLSSEQNVGCLRLHSPPKACPGKMLRAKGDDANSSGANFLGTLDSHDDSRKFHPEATKPT